MGNLPEIEEIISGMTTQEIIEGFCILSLVTMSTFKCN